MQREICWWLATCHANGERVVDTCDWRRWTATASDVAAERPQVRSFSDLALAEWMTAWSTGSTPITAGSRPGSRDRAEAALRGMLPRLAIRYSDEPWWKHECGACGSTRGSLTASTSPTGTPPSGGITSRPGGCARAQVLPYILMEAGQLTWSTVAAVAGVRGPVQRVRHLPRNRPSRPRGRPAGLRPMALEFRAFLRQWRREPPAQKERGGPLDDRSVACTLRVIGNFYRAMNDYRADAAAATGDARWLELTEAHARLYRGEEFRADGHPGSRRTQLHQRHRPDPHARNTSSCWACPATRP